MFPIEEGVVVQLNPETVRNRAFAGCFMTITEPKPWGAKGYVQALGENRDHMGGQAYYRAQWDEMEPIGMAIWQIHYPKDEITDTKEEGETNG